MAFRRGRFGVSPAVGFLILAVSVTYAQAPEPTPSADFISGVTLVRDGQYQEAVTKLQAATAADADLEPGWYYLGVAHYYLGSGHQAAAEFGKAGTEFEAAIAALQKALELRPGRPETRLYIGRIYEQTGAWDQAIAVYAEELRLRAGKDTADVHNSLARAYTGAARYREAVEAAYQATLRDVNYVEALYSSGRALDALGEHDEAVKQLAQGKDILTRWADLQTRLARLTEEQRSDPELTEEKVAQEYGRAEEFATDLGLWPELSKALGMAYIHATKFAEGRNAFRDALDSAIGNSDDPDAATLVGVAYYREAQYLFLKQDVLFQAIQTLAGAEAAVNEALKKNPDYAPAHNALGQIYLLQALTFGSDPTRGIVSHTFEQAEEELKKALALDPNYVDAMLSLAKAYLGQQRYDEAAQQLGQALRLEPNRADLHAQLALTLVGQEKLDEARDEALAAMGLDNRTAPAYNAAGLVAYYQGNLGEAAQFFTKAIDLDPTHHQSHTNLGLALFQMRSWNRARDEFKKALDYLPEAVITNTAIQRSYLYYLVALTWSNIQSHDRAVGALNQALTLDPNYFDALRQLARDYAAMKEYRAAERALRRASQQSPGATDDASVLAQLGMVFEAAGEPHEALAAYSEALTKDPGNPEAKTGFARLHTF